MIQASVYHTYCYYYYYVLPFFSKWRNLELRHDDNNNLELRHVPYVSYGVKYNGATLSCVMSPTFRMVLNIMA